VQDVEPALLRMANEAYVIREAVEADYLNIVGTPLLKVNNFKYFRKKEYTYCGFFKIMLQNILIVSILEITLVEFDNFSSTKKN
jgi:hypothetical protein